MLLGSRVRLVRRADSLTAIFEPIVYNVGSITSHNSVGLRGLLTVIALLYLRKQSCPCA
jgi:hypothetical protein